MNGCLFDKSGFIKELPLMEMKKHFIKATEEYNTLEKNVPAHYFRGTYLSGRERNAEITVAVCGFYELYFNGEKITRGFLSPYISNTDDLIYYDRYIVKLEEGENVIGVLLGNGFHNNPGGYIWDFDKASFRSAPMFSLKLESDGEVLLVSGESFKVADSPIRCDDYRFGEHYDANYEIDGWSLRGFDDGLWKSALPATPPKGEIRIADVEPIIKAEEIAPVEIIKCSDGYIYDFGVSNAGVCRLRVSGERGQKIILRHADSIVDGEPNVSQIWDTRFNWDFVKDKVHTDSYVCRGEGEEVYEPSFTYHGFRYVKVYGITESQATKELLTYLVYHTKLDTVGDFSCSDPMANKIQQITRRSTLSNFHHFPTDCPQREKNGWCADAALSCETALLNFNPERNYREWIRNVCLAQREDGALPGIVPTGGWGFEWGNGPAWDCVLAYLPYYTYILRGEVDMIREAAPYLMRYLRYLEGRKDEKGLLAIGLGDWCHVGGWNIKAPLVVTDTIISMDIAAKAAVMFRAVNMSAEAEYALDEAKKYRDAIRKNLIDFNSMTVFGECQSCQAMALYYGVFEDSEKACAFEILLDFVHAAGDSIDLGVLGGKVIFHVLSDFGYSDLAFKMITKEEYPSYGNWIKRGATTLWENFLPDSVFSMNHQFWGDVSAWFIKCLAGIKLNPHGQGVNTLEISPSFVDNLDSVSAYHIAPAGKISVSWRRVGEEILLELQIPEGILAEAKLGSDYSFENGVSSRDVVSGSYKIVSKA